jgi:glycosyltransferase involved in cell wall biosynthesis
MLMSPHVSIIIPMKNEELRIGRCLDSIAEGSHPMADCEVLIVDGGSTDRSCSIAESKLIQFPFARLIHNPKKTLPAGLNMAVRLARGSYIIRMDAHCEYQGDYIETCLAELVRTGAANVGGLLITLPGKNTRIARCIAQISQHPVCVGNSAFRLGVGNQFVDTVPFGAFRREVLDVVGLYREDLPRNQDYELNARIRTAGYQIYLSSKLQTKYYNSENLTRFIAQAKANGQGVARCWSVNPGSFSCRHVVPLLFVVMWLILLTLSIFVHYVSIACIVCASFYIAALMYAAIQIGLSSDLSLIMFVPVIIVIYHISYGVWTFVGALQIVTTMAAVRFGKVANAVINCERATIINATKLFSILTKRLYWNDGYVCCKKYWQRGDK